MAKGKRARRLNKDEHFEQKHCNSCCRPINKNCYTSEKMAGLCGSCYRIDIKENIKRKTSKVNSKVRNQERNIKTFLMTY